jgi:hypothetical protein
VKIAVISSASERSGSRRHQNVHATAPRITVENTTCIQMAAGSERSAVHEGDRHMVTTVAGVRASSMRRSARRSPSLTTSRLQFFQPEAVIIPSRLLRFV